MFLFKELSGWLDGIPFPWIWHGKPKGQHFGDLQGQWANESGEAAGENLPGDLGFPETEMWWKSHFLLMNLKWIRVLACRLVLGCMKSYILLNRLDWSAGDGGWKLQMTHRFVPPRSFRECDLPAVCLLMCPGTGHLGRANGKWCFLLRFNSWSLGATHSFFLLCFQFWRSGLKISTFLFSNAASSKS